MKKQKPKPNKMMNLIEAIDKHFANNYPEPVELEPTYFPETWEEIWGWDDIDFTTDDIPGNR